MKQYSLPRSLKPYKPSRLIKSKTKNLNNPVQLKIKHSFFHHWEANSFRWSNTILPRMNKMMRKKMKMTMDNQSKQPRTTFWDSLMEEFGSIRIFGFRKGCFWKFINLYNHKRVSMKNKINQNFRSPQSK